MRTTILAFAATLLAAQTFEVASVKINHSGAGPSTSPFLMKGRLEATNATMREILQSAWGLSATQITGPSWIDSDRYDIDARSPAGVPDSESKPMLQSLLRERFALQAHMESKVQAVFNLVVAKEGLKIHPVDPAHPLVPPPRRPGAWGMLVGRGTMEQLATDLARTTGRTVVEKTGLSGTYGYVVQYARLDTAEDTNNSDIFAAVQEQLGLKLEPAKAALPVLVVDQAQRVPTAN